MTIRVCVLGFELFRVDIDRTELLVVNEEETDIGFGFQ